LYTSFLQMIATHHQWVVGPRIKHL